MSKKNNQPLFNIIEDNENIFFSGKPELIPYVINNVSDDIPAFIIEFLFGIIAVPLLAFFAFSSIPKALFALLVILWILSLIPMFGFLSSVFQAIKEHKNVFYIVSDKAIYIQFGTKTIYYRTYPNDRIGTKVFYRQNFIDDMFGVGTLGFSVDNYYEERIISVKDYESLYNVLKEVTNSRREELQKIQEERERQKKEFEEQAKFLKQEELFLKHQEEEEERNRREKYEREMQERFERERLEHERFMKEREERRRRHELASQFAVQEPDKDDDDDDEVEISGSFFDVYDSGTEIEEKPPSDKTVSNYRRNRFVSNSKRPAGRKNVGKTIQPEEKRKSDISSLWASTNNSEDEEEDE